MNKFVTAIIMVVLLSSCQAYDVPSSKLVLNPAISPDGNWLAYSYRDGKGVAVYKTSLIRRSTPLKISSTGQDFGPVFSPDGESIAYVFNSKHKRCLMMCRSDGTDSRIVFETAGGLGQPLFSRDGKAIFISMAATFRKYSPIVKPDWHDWEVFKISLSGAPPVQLTNSKFYDSPGLSLAPDGSRLLLNLVLGAGPRMYELMLDGSAPSRHTPKPVYYGVEGKWTFDASYFPHDESILFLMDTGSGNRDLFILDMKSDKVRRLTDLHSRIVWAQPDGNGKTIWLLREPELHIGLLTVSLGRIELCSAPANDITSVTRRSDVRLEPF